MLIIIIWKIEENIRLEWYSFDSGCRHSSKLMHFKQKVCFWFVGIPKPCSKFNYLAVDLEGRWQIQSPSCCLFHTLYEMHPCLKTVHYQTSCHGPCYCGEKQKFCLNWLYTVYSEDIWIAYMSRQGFLKDAYFLFFFHSMISVHVNMKFPLTFDSDIGISEIFSLWQTWWSMS